VALENQAVAEALVFAQANGVDPTLTYDIIESSVATSPYIQYKRPRFLETGLAPEARLKLLHKDVALALEAAAASHVTLPATRFVGSLLARALEDGLGDADLAAVLTILEDSCHQ
jgi:3-hydroxyisobutyrate dehydrogenase-like beta-hydroxyacid dehydrogenase